MLVSTLNILSRSPEERHTAIEVVGQTWMNTGHSAACQRSDDAIFTKTFNLDNFALITLKLTEYIVFFKPKVFGVLCLTLIQRSRDVRSLRLVMTRRYTDDVQSTHSMGSS